MRNSCKSDTYIILNTPRYVAISTVLFLTLLMIAGCSEGELSSSSENIKEQSPSLLIGLMPERNIFEQLERYEPLAGYLSEKTGIGIKLQILTRYGNIIDNFVSAGMDGAFFGSFTYTLAHEKLGVEALARPVSIEGVSTYHGLIFVRRDSGIKGVKDMKGKTFVFVDKATTAGYLLPLAFFKKHGIEDHRTYLKESYFSGTHEDAIYDVLQKKADIGAAKNTEYNRLANFDIRITKELTILETSPEVPQNGFAVRKNLDKEIKNKLKKALLHMHSESEGERILINFAASRFVETTDSDYASVYTYAKAINLDLSTYDYLND